MSERTETEVRVMVLLGIVRQLMTSREAKLFAGLPVNPSQFGVLNHFTHKPQRRWTVTELAEVMEMNQPGITKIVSVLTDKGLLLTEADANDKRRRYLKITPQGLSLCKDVFTELGPDIAHVFADWNDTELSQMQQQMEKLMSWLDQHRDDIKSA